MKDTMKDVSSQFIWDRCGKSVLRLRALYIGLRVYATIINWATVHYCGTGDGIVIAGRKCCSPVTSERQSQ